MTGRRSRRRLVASLIAVPLGAALLVGCVPAASAPANSDDAITGPIVVFAAASLTESFAQVADAFEAENPGTTVTLSHGGSSALAAGIESGAPVDVFASANAETMATITDAGLASGPRVFARTELQIAVPAGNPGNVTGLADFADRDRTIALCAPEVPCGSASARVFDIAGITPAPDTLEQDVRAALTKVELGAVDAAIVYRTDVLVAGDAVQGIDFAEASEAPAEYSVVALSGAPNSTAASAFTAFVLGDSAQRILASAGFTVD
ncbi:molybdate transport system substrate-binding protein [Marisediminicola sp. UYEF4]|uniref:molybdate ABC transporter substrate-binding protein n=1 Tax=Marisediminicola sp. UYEF4 TaxID=1756384 RepID=UPI00339645AD